MEGHLHGVIEFKNIYGKRYIVEQDFGVKKNREMYSVIPVLGSMSFKVS